MTKGLSLFFYCFVLLIIQLSVGLSQEVVSETLSNDVNGESTEDTLIIQEQSVESIVIEETNDKTIYTIDTFKSYTVKQLKGFLSERGLTCHGCSEKNDFIQMAFEQQSVQIIPQPPPEPPKAPETSEPPENMDEIMAKLRQQGFGNSKFFNAADLNGLSPEEISDMISGKKPKKSSKATNEKKNEKKTDKKTKKTSEENKSKEKETKEKESSTKNTKSSNEKKDKTSNAKDSKKKTSEKEKTSNKKSSTKDSKSSKKEPKQPKESKKAQPEQPKRSFAKPIEEVVDEEIIEL